MLPSGLESEPEAVEPELAPEPSAPAPETAPEPLISPEAAVGPVDPLVLAAPLVGAEAIVPDELSPLVEPEVGTVVPPDRFPAPAADPEMALDPAELPELGPAL
jgi:hypothetical protein